MSPVDTFHLGFCDFAGRGFARLRPTMSLRSGSWVPVLNPRTTFPDVGKVFTHDGPILRSARNSPWVFRCIQNGRLGEDRFLAADPQQPCEVLAFPSLDREKTRRVVVETGLELADPPSQEVLVVFEKDRALRIRLRQDEANGRWKAAHDQDLERLSTWSFERAKVGMAVIEQRWFLRHHADLGEPTGMVDWSSDMLFVGKVLAKLRKTQRFGEGGDMAALSRAAVERFNTALRDAELLSSDPVVDDAMRVRLASTADTLQKIVTGAADLGNTLLQMPSVQAVMRREIDANRQRELAALRSELLASAEQEIEKELEDKREVVDLLNRDIEGRRVRADALQQELLDIARERDELRAQLAGDTGRLVETMGRAAEAFGRAADMTRHPRNADAHSMEPWFHEWSEPRRNDARPITAVELGDELKRHERRRGFATGSMLTLDAFARAGELVVLFGDDAERMLDAYVDAIAAGATWRMPLDPTFLGLDDLWRHPTGKGPTTFAAAWLEAERKPDTHVVVVLEDLDSALSCSWLPALATRLRHVRRPPNLIVFATLVEGTDTRGPSSAILRAGMPFAALARPASFAAAAAAVLNPQEIVVTILRADAPKRSSPEALTDLLAGLGAVPGIDPIAAVRAARLLQVAETTLGKEAATALAVDAAVHLSPAVRSAGPAGSNIGDAFEKLTQRQARTGI